MTWYADFDAAGRHAFMLVLPPGKWSVDVRGERYHSSLRVGSEDWFTIPFAFPPEEARISARVEGSSGEQPWIIALPGVPVPFRLTRVGS